MNLWEMWNPPKVNPLCGIFGVWEKNHLFCGLYLFNMYIGQYSMQNMDTWLHYTYCNIYYCMLICLYASIHIFPSINISIAISSGIQREKRSAIHLLPWDESFSTLTITREIPSVFCVITKTWSCVFTAMSACPRATWSPPRAPKLPFLLNLLRFSSHSIVR